MPKSHKFHKKLKLEFWQIYGFLSITFEPETPESQSKSGKIGWRVMQLLRVARNMDFIENYRHELNHKFNTYVFARVIVMVYFDPHMKLWKFSFLVKSI